MSKKRKIILVSIVLIVIIGIFLLLNYLNSVKNYKEKVANTQITDVDISKVPDGTYIGDYDVDFIYVKVEVAVKDGKITDIKLLEHKNERGEDAESIIDTIVKDQTLNVDAVSGATNSSTVIKKAIEEALLKRAPAK